MKLCVQLAWTYATALVYFAYISKGSAQVVLTADPPWSEMFPGDTVTLTCHINGSGESLEGWNFTWSRSTPVTPEIINITIGQVGPVHVLSPVRETDQGQYRCTGQNKSDSLYSNSHELIVSGDRPQALLTQEPPFPVLFAGENVTLRCEVRKGSHWRYTWAKKNRRNILEKLVSKYDDGHQTYTLQSVKVRDSGQYFCHAEYMNNPLLQPYSGLLSLEVLEKTPKAILKMSVGEIYTGERLTLTCTVEGGSTGWTYLWYRDTQGSALSNIDSNRTDGSIYTISSSSPSNSGRYWCQAHRVGFHSNYSDWHEVNIQVIPQPILSLQSGWTNVFPTETVTLRCEVRGGSARWLYKWYRDGEEIPASGDGDTYAILSAARSHSGQYRCRGELPERAVTTMESNVLNLTVHGTEPKVQVTMESCCGNISEGDTLTLRCAVQGSSAGWRYLWYKDTEGSALSNIDSNRTDGSIYTVSSAVLSTSGRYCCEAHRGGFYSNYSDWHEVNIQVVPQPVLSLQSGWTNAFPTETVTLKCEVRGSSAHWLYKWYRDGQEVPASGDGDTYAILSAAQSHSGQYRCRGELPERAVTTMESNVLNLTVYETSPKPQLSMETPNENIYTEDRLSLTCTVEGGSTGWKYLWYKDTQGPALPDTDSNGTDGSIYAISSSSPSHSGRYWCQAHRGGFYSNYSDLHEVNIQVRPQAVLSLDTAWTQILTGDSLILRCEIQGNFSGWNYTWCSDGLWLPLEHDGETFSMSFLKAFHQPEYRCKGIRTENPFYSDISNVLVPRKYVINLTVGLLGSVLFFVILLVLFVVCKKPCRKSDGKKGNDTMIHLVNMDYVSADDIEPSAGIYEEIGGGSGGQGDASVLFYCNIQPNR